MKYNSLILEKKEYVLLKRFLNLSIYSKDIDYIASIKQLSKALQFAQILDEKEMPKDIVRFNSVITLDLAESGIQEVELVVPIKSNKKAGKISILSPLGMALIGRAGGDSISGDLIPGTTHCTIVGVTQPNDRSLLSIAF
ncbi:GreA/GreB family elongation factor [Arenibacter sp. GZD96]|uniref:GreA/GreB family elongation factor n=1 Tax=Aurantibrevibacter litoralis TaxID=3106030 RepID=UPI002AFE73E3|nr:GreA/GreB family elongation factor [Arenibacter sp. GZD-96]MEA1787547.1 GreA/GreB family elongation factor [Arenibacter sp. GZD-96]